MTKQEYLLLKVSQVSGWYKRPEVQKQEVLKRWEEEYNEIVKLYPEEKKDARVTRATGAKRKPKQTKKEQQEVSKPNKV